MRIQHDPHLKRDASTADGKNEREYRNTRTSETDTDIDKFQLEKI